ncbi:MAG: GAF domain-containing sensor histidine kinase [Armatimonadetes bacterium]|nr:GAF domain-containing sensor histidine kinase [Armatimonadota bacterium]
MPDRERRLISAVHLATQKLSTTKSVEETLREVLEICVEAAGAYGGTIYIHDPAGQRLRFRHVLPAEVRKRLPMEDIPDDFGIAGQVFQERAPRISRFEPGDGKVRSVIERATSVYVSTMLTAPLMVEGAHPIGVVQLINKGAGEFGQSDLEVIETVSAVSAMAYLNSILTEQASRAASLMGMGKVSHDIGNLAAALQAHLNFVRPMIERLAGMCGEDRPLRSTVDTIGDSLGDLSESIHRVVAYSRLISDLAAGRPLRPEKRPGMMPEIVGNAAAFYESEARRRGVALKYEIAECDEQSLFDAQFVFRIVQNLVGNALKAVSEEKQANASERVVWVRYRRVGDDHVIEVEDSGPGMTEEVLRTIRAGTAISRWTASGGTGWGTKIVRELATSHGGTIGIESEPGAGTRFSVILPVVAPSDSGGVDV